MCGQGRGQYFRNPIAGKGDRKADSAAHKVLGVLYPGRKIVSINIDALAAGVAESLVQRCSSHQFDGGAYCFRFQRRP